MFDDEIPGTAYQRIQGSRHPMQSWGSRGLSGIGSEAAGNFGELSRVV